MSERPEGYAWRPLGMDDVRTVYELEALVEAFAGGEVEIALADVEADWRMPAFDSAAMTTGVFRDGATSGRTRRGSFAPILPTSPGSPLCLRCIASATTVSGTTTTGCSR